MAQFIGRQEEPGGRKKQCYFIFILCLFPFLSFGWDPMGHKVIAGIAYAHLTPAAKKQVDQITQTGDPNYPSLARFLYAAALPDIWRETDPSKKNWHYDNQPWSIDGTPTDPASDINFITALQRNIAILINPTATLDEKFVSLAWVEHLVGDAHQPLHCINLFSKDFPQGDKGGNLFLIKNKDTNNLHAYWDQIVHEFNPSLPYPLTHANVTRLSQKLESQNPPDDFGNQSNDLKFDAWETECYQLAKTKAYDHLKPNDTLSPSYQAVAQVIAGQQLTLAGYRLAQILNMSFLKS